MPTIEGKDTFVCADLYEGSCDKSDDWEEARRVGLISAFIKRYILSLGAAVL